MAAAESLLTTFLSQNSIILIAAVLITVIVVALSTYYIARSYSPSSTSDTHTVYAGNQEETSKKSAAANRSPCITTVGHENGDENGRDEFGNNEESVAGTEEEPAVDPLHYCEHIQGEIKKVKQDVTTRKICETLSAEQIAEERQRQKDQLAEIFRLMQGQQERFGINSMDEMQDQMRLYANI